MPGQTSLSQTRVIVPHAQKRMRARGITEEAIDWVLDNHHQKRPAQQRPDAAPADIYVGDFQGRRLRVYVQRDSNPPMIKTAAWES